MTTTHRNTQGHPPSAQLDSQCPAVYPIYRCIAPTIRILFTGGDRVICRQVPDYRLVVNYGMSETSGVVVGNTITEPTEKFIFNRHSKGDICYCLNA